MKAISRPLSIWTHQAVKSGNGWLINGVAIFGHPKAIHGKDNPFTLFWKILRSYFYRSADKVSIVVSVNGTENEIETDENGNFELLVDDQAIKTLTFLDSEDHKELDILQKGDDNRHYDYTNDKFLIISDIDDTILVSHSARKLSKLWLMLFKPIPKRNAVEESELAYRELRKANFSFAYVSASEYNLFTLVSSFIELHKLPLGPIYLRPHQEFKDLFGKTEREDYKVNRIIKLLQHFPEERIVLFGDDSQQDFTVFGKVAENMPNRIHSVYLRKTGSLKTHGSEKVTWEMPDGSIPVHYYDSYSNIQSDIKQLINENSGSR